MRILVTGASGLVGRALVEELRARKDPHEVLGLERRHGDLAAGEDVVAEYMRQFRPELVVHLAALVGAQTFEADPDALIRSNVIATAHVAAACRDHGARLAYASTMSLHAPGTSLYVLTKKWGEEVSELYAREGLQILRLAHPYGPGWAPDRGRGAVGIILANADAREPIHPYRGDIRSWCWIGDVASAIRVVLERGGPGTFEIGRGDEPVSMTELALRACALTGASPELVEEADPPSDHPSINVDDAPLRALGWQPQVDLDTGMRRLLDWLRAERTAAVS